jgi:hypothetical protein
MEDNEVSPEEFLRHVRQLSTQKDQEDKTRTENLEREIQKSREARRARRAGKFTSWLLSQHQVTQKMFETDDPSLT